MEIKLDQTAASELVQKAMFELLTEQTRDELVKGALATLMKRPPKTGYGTPELPSPLEMAFESGLRTITFEVVREYLDDEKIRESIRSQILAVLKGMIEDKGTWLYEQIGTAVGKSIQATLEEERPKW